MIDATFLNVRFTDISLLHILILIGIPYIVFYIFEMITKFDKFSEKWEGALFIFSSGGTITLLSLLFQSISGYSFYLFYIILLAYLVVLLWIIKLKFLQKENSKGWIRVQLKNGDIYIGSYLDSDFLYLKIGKKDSGDMLKIPLKGKKKTLEAKQMIIRKEDINKIFYY
jgi:hypothetical protein